MSRLYGTFKYPETYLIDRAGKVVQKVIGPANWSDPQMLDYMEQLLRGCGPRALSGSFLKLIGLKFPAYRVVRIDLGIMAPLLRQII